MVARVSGPLDASNSSTPAVLPPGGPADAPPRTPTAGMAAKLTRGAVWSFLGLFISQGSSVLSQIVLGYKLSTEFALYMVAVAALSTIGIIRDVGLRKILVVRGSEYDTLARPVFLVALAINVACALALLVAAPFLARHSFETYQPRLIPMMWVIAASVVLSTFGSVQAAKLSIDLRFKAGAAQAAASGVLRQLSQAIFALAGAGAMSFVWPMVVVALFDAMSLRWLVGPIPKGGRLTLELLKELFHLSKWIMAALLGMVLTYRADGFIVARYEDLGTVVTYYGWAIALTVQALQPFTNVIYGLVLPAFSKIADDAARVRLAYLRMTGVVTFVSAPLVLAMCLACPIAIHLVWRGRWDPAIPAVALILAATPFKSLQACALAFDEAHARFRRSGLMLIADGVTALIAVTIGVLSGGLVAIASAILIQRSLFTAFHALYVGRSAGIPMRKMIPRTMFPLLIAAGMAAIVVVPAIVLAGSRANLVIGLLSAPAVGLCIFLSYLIMPDRWAETLQTVRSRGR